MEPRELLSMFNERYGGCICIDESTVCHFLSTLKDKKLATVDYLWDYVLANDMAEVVL